MIICFAAEIKYKKWKWNCLHLNLNLNLNFFSIMVFTTSTFVCKTGLDNLYFFKLKYCTILKNIVCQNTMLKLI